MIPILLLCLGIASADVGPGAAAWDRGDAPGAIATWQGSWGDGAPSGIVLYDLGVAYYRMGDAPRAIAHFQAARRLRPRDAMLVHNLARARNKVTGAPTPARPRQGWAEFVTAGEASATALLLLVVAAAGLVYRRLRQPDAVRFPWVALGIAGLAVALTAGAAVRDTWWHPVVVVVDAPAVARDSARADAVERFVLPPGSEVRVQAVRPNWVLVETGDGERGWIPRGAAFYVGPPSILTPSVG